MRKVRVAVSPFFPSGTYLSWVLEDKSSAALFDTVPTPAHVEPSVEYCQVPLPGDAVRAIPSGSPSTSCPFTADRIVETRAPALVVSSLVLAHT